MSDASCNGEQPQGSSSQEFTPLPGNQLQSNSLSRVEPQKPSPSQAVLYKSKQLDEMVSQFEPFDQFQNLGKPFEEEFQRDNAYVRDQARELVELVMETWAWSTARILYTTRAEASRLSEQFETTMNAEKAQDEVCKRVQEFVSKMRSALDALQAI